MTDFFDVVRHQRAYRAFLDRDVEDELVERCLEAATRAPSAENRQPWEFVVVRDAGVRAAVGEIMRSAWHQAGRAWSEARLSPELLAAVDKGAEGGVAAAPVLVVVCGNAELALPTTLPSSIYPATQNLLLAAGALGLGSAMTTLATTKSDELRALLGLPDHVLPMAVIPLGWPVKPLGPSRREPVATRAHRDAFGKPW